MKFHINKHGVPTLCRAQKGNCPYGGGEDGLDNHFNTEEEAQAYIDKRHESVYGMLPSETLDNMPTEDRERKEYYDELRKEMAEIEGKLAEIDPRLHVDFTGATENPIDGDSVSVLLRENNRSSIVLMENLHLEGAKERPPYARSIDEYEEELLEDFGFSYSDGQKMIEIVENRRPQSGFFIPPGGFRRF